MEPSKMTPPTLPPTKDDMISSVHRTLNIPELLDLIVALVIEEQNTSSICHKSALACVSRQFHEVFIRHTWATPDFQDLFSLFTTCLTKTKEFTSEEKWALLHQPTPSDWARFMHYSAYVKDLDIWRPPIAPSLLAIFDDVDGKVFPRLRRMAISFAAGGVDMIIPRIPGLETLLLETSFSARAGPVVNITGLVQQLPQCTPQLSKLEIHLLNSTPGLPMDEPAQNLIVNSLRSLPALTTLGIFTSYIPDPIYRWIAAHHTLSVIRLETVGHPVILDNPEQDFHAPLSLDLAGTDDGVRSLLTLATLTSLKDLQLSFTPPTRSVRHVRLHSLSSFGHAANLTSISIMARHHQPWARNATISWYDLRQLLTCQGVTSFALQSCLRVDGWGDAAIGEMASAWADLKSIQVGSSSYSEPITLGGLGQLATYLPGLSQVEVSPVALHPSRCTLYHPVKPRPLVSRHFRLSLGVSNWCSLPSPGLSNLESHAQALCHFWPGLRSDNIRDGEGWSYRDSDFDKWRLLKDFLDQKHEANKCVGEAEAIQATC